MVSSLEALGKDVFVSMLDKRKGPAHARNLAAKHASGDILIFVDSDVLVPPSVFSSLAKVAEGQVYVPATLPLPINLPFGLSPDGYATKSAEFFSDFALAPKIIKGKLLPVSACFSIRKQDFEKVGGFDEAFKHPAGEDWDFFTRINSSGIEVKFNENIRVFHRNPVTASGVIRRSYRYARHGSSEIVSASDIKTPSPIRYPTSIFGMIQMPYFLFLAFVKMALSSLSVGSDIWFRSAVGLKQHVERRMTSEEFKMQDSDKNSGLAQSFMYSLSNLVNLLISLPIANPWSIVLQVRQNLTEKDKRSYRFLIVLWRLSFTVGYLVRESRRICKENSRPRRTT
jgi:GT2 family glycosyltransferase